MTDLQILIVIMAVCHFFTEYFLKIINERHIKNLTGSQPNNSKHLMDEHTWEKASNYSLSKSKFSRVEEVFGFIKENCTFLFYISTSRSVSANSIA